jgi:hypothetical protein
VRATCSEIAHRATTESPTDSLAHVAFGTAGTPLARLARPRVADFVGWAKREARAHHQSSRTIVGGHAAFPPPSRGLKAALRPLSPPYGSVHDLVGLGPGLTPSGDDFLIGAMAGLAALGQTNTRAVLGRAIVAAAHLTSPLSASLLRTAAAGHVGENLHAMVAALVTGDADAAIAAARHMGHTSGFDALTGAVVTMRAVANASEQET